MLLCFDPVKKAKDPQDCGRYQPNMSDGDKEKFRARHVKGSDERIEIRTSRFGSETVIAVYRNPKRKDPRWFSYDDHDSIRISSNSKMHLTFEDWKLLLQAVDEARHILGV